MSGFIDFAAVRHSVSLPDIVSRYVDLKPHGHEWSGLCPFHDERSPSFTVAEGKGFFHCFGCGAHGDVIDFVRLIEDVDHKTAVDRLANGVTTQIAEGIRKRNNERRRIEAERKARALKTAWEIWIKSRTRITGTPVDTYLSSRGIAKPSGGWPPTLRFHPAVGWHEPGHPQDGSCWPAMVALMSIDQRFAGIHRTYIAPAGMGKAPLLVNGKPKVKKMLGSSTGGAIRLAPPRAHIHVGEGIETVLSVRQALPRRAYWVAGSIERMASLQLPPEVRDITLLMDNDMKDPALGPRIAEKARVHYGRGGVTVRAAWARAGFDFNDMLNGG